MDGTHTEKNRLKGKVLRWTLSREAVLDILSGTLKHMSAKEIHSALLKKYPGIGLSTVYRTLEFLGRAGVINKLDIGDGKSRYEFRSHEKNAHHHLICTNCGKIIDYSDFLEEELESARDAEKRLARKYNFKVQNHNIAFYGLCENCQR